MQYSKGNLCRILLPDERDIVQTEQLLAKTVKKIHRSSLTYDENGKYKLKVHL